LATSFALLALANARAQNYDERLVDPYEAHSPDSAWTLFVDPSSPRGRGPATYRLVHGEDVVWTKVLPGTLRDVQLVDDGAFAGWVRTDADALRLWLVGADGKLRFDESLQREDHVLDGASYPNSRGIVFDLARDRVLFRIAHAGPNYVDEEWRVARLSTGKLIAILHPKPPFDVGQAYCLLGAVKPIEGVPLLACAWVVEGFGGSRDGPGRGVQFVVTDFDAKPVARIEARRDYEARGDEELSQRLLSWAYYSGASIESGGASRFKAVFAADEQLRTYELRRDGASATGWSAQQIAVERYTPPDVGTQRPLAAPVELALLQLTFLGAIELAAGELPQQLLGPFDMDDRGRSGQVVVEPGQAARFELRGATGELVADFELGAAAAADVSGATWIRGDRWLVDARTRGPEPVCRAWWLDVADGTLTEVAGIDSAPIERADGTFDGGFVALSIDGEGDARVCTLSSFDAEGRLRWRKPLGEGDRAWSAARDVCVNPLGEIGVLDSYPPAIRRFDARGEPLAAIELDRLREHGPSDPSHLGAASDGAWIVYDSIGSPSVLRVSRDRKSRSSFCPRFADGRSFGPLDGIHGSCDGRMWASDGYALLRLDSAGVVDLVAGREPDATDLGPAECGFVDASGRTYLADSRTHAVHVFDSDGQRVAVCECAREELLERTFVGNIAVAMDGSVHVGLADPVGSRTCVFDAGGERIGSENSDGESIFQPAKEVRWSIRFGEIDLFGADGALTHRATRSPDDKWLSEMRAHSVAADGSLAVTSRGKVHVFSADGAARLTIDAPGIESPSIAFTGTQVFLLRGTDLRCVDLASRAARATTLCEDVGDFALPFWRADSNELWILDLRARRVLRYRTTP
jgi:hypothetical protein